MKIVVSAMDHGVETVVYDGIQVRRKRERGRREKVRGGVRKRGGERGGE